MRLIDTQLERTHGILFFVYGNGSKIIIYSETGL